MNTSELIETTRQFLVHPSHLTAVVATSEADQSHAATVYYSIDDDFHFYFLTATNTKKYNNLQANDQASIVVGFGPEHVTLQGSGTTALLEKNSDEERFAIELIKGRLAKTNVTWPVFQLSEYDGESIAVFKLTLTELYLLNLEHDNGLTTTPDEPTRIL